MPRMPCLRGQAPGGLSPSGLESAASEDLTLSAAPTSFAEAALAAEASCLTAAEEMPLRSEAISLKAAVSFSTFGLYLAGGLSSASFAACS